MISYGNGIYAVDANYLRPGFAAIHLIAEGGKLALVDTGCNDSLQFVEAALGDLGFSPADVDFILLTHIHLDHAGGAGLMMKAFPKARLVVHPRGVRHMVDPSMLVAGATAVYGAESVRRLYGEVMPVDPARIVEATHESIANLNGRELLCLDTPGHARHHIGIVDRQTGHVFTGDTFGLSYRELDTDGRQFLLPATTPIQFDPVAMHASIDMIAAYSPGAVYLTHYGQVRDVARKAKELHRSIDAYVSISRQENREKADRHARILSGIKGQLLEETRRFGCKLSESRILEIFANDLELNAQGLGVWLDTSNDRNS